jgi:hypothetical protein
MKKYYLLSTLIFLCFTFASFAQLDSVYYMGPSAGNVPSGVMVTLSPFTFDEPATGTIIPDRHTETPYFDPNPADVIPGNLPPYVYVEDSPVTGQNNVVGDQTIVLNKWDGIPMTNSIPPDPIMAVGPDHVIVCVNSAFWVWDKEGNLLATLNADAWIGPVVSAGAFDPQIIYDHYSERWFMLWDWQDATSQQAWFIISYSETSNPFGTWFMYKMDARVNGTSNSGTWADYPQIGFDDEAVYINSRSFSWAGYYQYNRIRILDKSELYASNGGVLPFVDIYNIGRPGVPSDKPDVLNPAISYTPGQGGYFFNTLQNGGSYYLLYKLLNPTSASPRLRGRIISTTTYGAAPLANQLGGGLGIESGGSKSRHAPKVRDGFLYVAHSIANSTNGAYSSVRYNKIEITGASILEQSELGAVGYYYLYPALAIDKDNNIAVTFSRSATTEYAGAFFSCKYANDPPGLNPSVLLQEGLGNYEVTFGSNPPRNRWGDYMGIYLDMNNEREIWTFTEYVRATNSWGTYVGRILIAPFPGAHAYPMPSAIDFMDIETGTESQKVTVILANYGDGDLVIPDIPSTYDDFNFQSTISFPLTLASYDSVTLEFSYSPTSEGTVDVVYPISSSDPDFSGIELSGTGYDATPTEVNKLYASTGAGSSGAILTIDPITGSGTEIGLSTYNEVTSISINPLDGKLYGLVAATGSSDLVKLNAAEGDAHLVYTLNIPLMAGIAFDTSGTLYGVTRVGEVYTIDLTQGTTSFVVDAVGSYSGVTFNPETNELWASSRAVTPPNKDAIFTVDLMTGDTTIVGHTGLNKQTNAITFDNNINLYGVIGNVTELNDLVSINISSGAGTIIGSVGYKNILGLAYSRAITDVKDDNNSGLIPANYVLRQNYPNPFNPTTRIDFSLPAVSNVKLEIFNILGQKLVTLLNEQMNSGNHSITWDSRDANGNKLTSGIYLYKLTASGINGSEFQDTKKMILMK